MEDLIYILEHHYSLIDLQKIATKLDKVFRLNNFWNGWNELEKELFNNINIDINYLKSHYHYRDIYNLIIMRYGKTERIPSKGLYLAFPTVLWEIYNYHLEGISIFPPKLNTH